MLFDTLEFWIFLATVLGIYFVLNHRKQNLWLLIASYTFYAFWDWRFLSLILFSTLVDFTLSNKIFNTQGPARKHLLILSLISNLGILFTFKYFNFFVDSFILLGAQAGLNLDTPTLRLVPPIGISFYTFQTLAYTIDVYRKEIRPEKNFVCFAVFVSYFPQLIAGPIERANNLLPQFRKPRVVTTECIKAGLVLILIGLFKKIVIADNAGIRVNDIFADPESYTSGTLWKGAILFSLQIYGDFSGYSNIARGVSRLLGIHLSENFKTPFFSRNIAEFWKRWHITLSEWLRDYLYIPLGGNRHGLLKAHRNLMATMFLGGLWHGASVTFIAWGVIHGLMLMIFHTWRKLREATFPTKSSSINHTAHAKESESAAVMNQAGTPHFLSIFRHTNLQSLLLHGLSIAFTFIMVCLTFVIFRAETPYIAWEYVQGLFSWRGNLTLHDLAFPALMLCMLLPLELYQYRHNDDLLRIRNLPLVPRACLYCFLILAILYSSNHETPFIYFQF